MVTKKRALNPFVRSPSACVSAAAAAQAIPFAQCANNLF
jgi:hypothetical protein